MRSGAPSIFVAALFLSHSACIRIAASVATPTALERQLLGEYERLDDELVWASSVRGMGGREVVSFEVLKGQAVEARAVQRYNEDDLLELKGAKCIAESSEGRVIARPCARADQDETARRVLVRVLREENAARDTILLWVAHELSRKQGRLVPTPAELRELRMTYARLLREAAKPGHLIEAEPGKLREVAAPAP